jgi:hypothetical protein
MIQGLLIQQSLENLDFTLKLKITKEEKWNIDDAGEGQDKIWNVAWFEADESEADEIANDISESLKDGKWFVDFRDSENVFVIFKNKIFKYKKGDKIARAEVENYATEIVGVPKTQLNWEE